MTIYFDGILNKANVIIIAYLTPDQNDTMVEDLKVLDTNSNEIDYGLISQDQWDQWEDHAMELYFEGER